MITPRRTRLIRVPDLYAFQRIILALALPAPLDEVRRTAVIVPSRAAARQLRRTLENGVFGPADPERRAFVLPDVVVRDELYDLLRQRLPEPPETLSIFDREVILAAAARQTQESGIQPPFTIRPGLISAMLDLYDQIRRRQETTEAFDRVLSEELAHAVDDRGADRLLRQTAFLAATYRRYEARVAASGRVDEHLLRERLATIAAPDPLRRIIVTTSDWIGEMPGLWKADFDLLARVPDLRQIDLVATSEMLASGFHERIKDWLPDLDEVEGRHICDLDDGERPVLRVPALEDDERATTFASRDREEELKLVARRIKASWRDRPDSRPSLERTAVVFQRPLPYLYLARGVFGGAKLPYQTLDALPLAAEPYAAALDLVFTFVSAGFTRDAIVALLRSPHVQFEHEGRVVRAAGVGELDQLLSRKRFLGGIESLEDILRTEQASTPPSTRVAWAVEALSGAVSAARELLPLTQEAPAAAHVRVLSDFLRAHDRPLFQDHPQHERRLRARAAILAALDALERAYAEYDNPVTSIDALAATIRRWIEHQTFAPADGHEGVHLMDAQTARYADLDHLHIVGLVEGEWPARPARNIFYPVSLLSRLRWPSEQDRLSAARAAFHDLLHLPRRTVSASWFRLENDGIVEPSSLVEDLDDPGLPVEQVTPLEDVRIFPDEALAETPVAAEATDGRAAEWLALRLARGSFKALRFHGRIDPQPARVYTASQIDAYRRCPFQYFAQRVLKLVEEPDDDDAFAARAQGSALHELLEDFYRQRDATGLPLNADTMEEIRALFVSVVDAHLAGLPDADAVLLRQRLLGSAARAGAVDSVLRMDLRDEIGVKIRLLEHAFSGTFSIAAGDRARDVQVSGRIDRIDLLNDGTFRLIDYKLGSQPGKHALQLPLYATCAEQSLTRERADGPWLFGEAAYVALKDPRIGRKVLSPNQLAEDREALLDTIEAIERGTYPARPADLMFCRGCGVVSVCRKDYADPEDREGDDRAE